MSANSQREITGSDGRNINILDFEIDAEIKKLMASPNKHNKELLTQEINKLFADSGKKIRIKDSLKITTLNLKALSFQQLSSGERQLLYILLTVANTEEKPTFLLMDEPEISLHLNWQEKLLDSIRAINPQCQIGFCRIKTASGNMLFFLRCYLTMSLIRKSFKRLHYPVDVIAQCVRWYLAYTLSLRNLEEMMAERGIVVDHSTLHRWVIRLVPLLDKAFRQHKSCVGRRWRMDETYIKIKGQWKYLYRAVDSDGQTIDFLLTAKRDAAAALRFFHKAIRYHGEPEVVTIDKSGANTAALSMLNANKPAEETITLRQSKYLNNLVEQDHRNIKRRIRAMLGFKLFRRAQTILAGIELVHMIRKGQLGHPTGVTLSPAEQFYLLAA